jgi:hypothetical protein
MPAPDLELDVRAPPPPRPPMPKGPPRVEQAIELGVDPRALVQERAAASQPLPPSFPGAPPVASGYAPSPHDHGAPHAHTPLLGVPAAASAPILRGAPAGAHLASADPLDVSTDAHVLAAFGEPPRSLFLTPMYAWRVLRRQRELKTALAGRKAEAEHAATEVEDALVAFTERVRPAAGKVPAYAAALEDLARAEEMLRSRDNVLAAEQDAQKARIGQVDARVTKMEEDLIQAQTNERLAAQDLAGAQSGLAREEAKLKRAEIELKGALQRTSGGGQG